MDKRIVLVFVKHPVAGQVKTRLAAGIGDEQALLVYQKLLQKTHDALIDGDWDIQVWYGNGIPDDDLWKRAGFIRQAQQGADLGARMHHAFTQAFDQGYTQAILIGSDLAEMDHHLLQQAFEAFQSHDAVIGPSDDGGYYLVGLQKALPDLFLGKMWSHPNVLQEAITSLDRAQRSYQLLPVCHDIDTEEDLKYLG